LGITAFALAGAAGLALYRRNLTQRRDYEQRLHELALSDSLTGLANRRATADRLDKALARARRGTGSVAVMYVDIDKFKTINDQHGHAAGDVILTAVADRLRRLFRAEDTIARLGGDEFAVVCEDLPLPEEAERLAARVRSALAEPYRIAGGTVLATASVGLAMTDGYTTADDLLDHADRHMYELKRPASGPVGTPTASLGRSS
jgi:diguanylate cyclase (GGDEF)-like protein